MESISCSVLERICKIPKPRSRRGNEVDFLATARNRPPRYLGGYHFSDTLLDFRLNPRLATNPRISWAKLRLLARETITKLAGVYTRRHLRRLMPLSDVAPDATLSGPFQGRYGSGTVVPRVARSSQPWAD